MTGSQRPVKFDVRKEVAELTKAPHIVASLVVFIVFLCAVPVLWFILPFAIIFMVILYKVGEGNSAKVKKIARAKMGGNESKLEIVEDMELASAMVLNDWGVIYLPSGKTQIEMAWSEIESVEETGLAFLEFNSGKKKIKADLAVRRYTLITEALNEKLPGRCHFLIDPKSGESELMSRLRKGPVEWKKVKLRIDDNGIEYDGNKMNWDEMVSVVEEEVFHHDSMNTHALSFYNGRTKFLVGSVQVSNGTGLPGSSAYDYLKAVTKEKLDRKASFIKKACTPYKRALDEFERSQDAMKAAFALALKSCKFHVIEPHFKNMLVIVDKYNLQDERCVQKYFHDYALLLQRTGREEEAQAMGRRVNMPLESIQNQEE